MHVHVPVPVPVLSFVLSQLKQLVAVPEHVSHLIWHEAQTEFIRSSYVPGLQRQVLPAESESRNAVESQSLQLLGKGPVQD